MPDRWSILVRADGQRISGDFTIPGIMLVQDQRTGAVYPLAGVIALEEPIIARSAPPIERRIHLKCGRLSWVSGFGCEAGC